MGDILGGFRPGGYRKHVVVIARSISSPSMGEDEGEGEKAEAISVLSFEFV